MSVSLIDGLDKCKVFWKCLIWRGEVIFPDEFVKRPVWNVRLGCAKTC